LADHLWIQHILAYDGGELVLINEPGEEHILVRCPTRQRYCPSRSALSLPGSWP